jgi:hypothetical protein
MIIDLPDGAESTSHTSRIVNVGVGSTEAWRDAARLNASLELRIIRDNEWVEETGRRSYYGDGPSALGHNHLTISFCELQVRGEPVLEFAHADVHSLSRRQCRPYS